MLEKDLVGRFKRVGFQHETALKLVSVLLWIQVAVEIPDFLNTILSLEDTVFLILAKEGEGLLGFLSDGHTDPASLSVSKLQALVDASRNDSMSITGLIGDGEMTRAFVNAKYEMLSKGKGKVKEGYSNADGESPAPSGALNQIGSSTHLNPAAQPFVPLISVDGGTEDERCLYLTFSKGHPLTSPEIVEFFTEMCNNNGGWRQQNPHVVKKVYIHKGDDGTALFGKVVFCNPYLPGFILDRQKEIKFVVNGKTLWCKRFMRRNSRNIRLEHHRGVSSRQVSGPRGGVGFGGTWVGNSWGGQFQGLGRSESSLLVLPHGVGTVVDPGPGWPVGQFLHPTGHRVVRKVEPPPPQVVPGVPGGDVMIELCHGGYYYHGMGGG